jgi:hypothetical protein
MEYNGYDLDRIRTIQAYWRAKVAARQPSGTARALRRLTDTVLRDLHCAFATVLTLLNGQESAAVKIQTRWRARNAHDLGVKVGSGAKLGWLWSSAKIGNWDSGAVNRDRQDFEDLLRLMRNRRRATNYAEAVFRKRVAAAVRI